jgi:hypothetical protein
MDLLYVGDGTAEFKRWIKVGNDGELPDRSNQPRETFARKAEVYIVCSMQWILSSVWTYR